MKRPGLIRGHCDSDGFTLLELLLVMTLMAILMGVAVFRVPSTSSSAQITSWARQIAATLRSARSQAVAANREARFVLDVENRAFHIDNQRTARLPPDINLTLDTALSELSDAATGAIRFFPDGSSTGGRIHLKSARDGGSTATVAVDWFTGRVSVAE